MSTKFTKLSSLTATYGETKLVAKEAESPYSCNGCFFKLPNEQCLASSNHENFFTGCISNGYKIWIKEE